MFKVNNVPFAYLQFLTWSLSWLKRTSSAQIRHFSLGPQTTLSGSVCKNGYITLFNYILEFYKHSLSFFLSFFLILTILWNNINVERVCERGKVTLTGVVSMLFCIGHIDEGTLDVCLDWFNGVSCAWARHYRKLFAPCHPW